VQRRAVGEQGAHLGVETGGIIERQMELLRPPGREGAAAPTAAASFQDEAGWARQRHLQPLQSSENPRERFARLAVAT
jgi:hypothetical protein